MTDDEAALEAEAREAALGVAHLWEPSPDALAFLAGGDAAHRIACRDESWIVACEEYDGPVGYARRKAASAANFAAMGGMTPRRRDLAQGEALRASIAKEVA